MRIWTDGGKKLVGEALHVVIPSHVNMVDCLINECKRDVNSCAWKTIIPVRHLVTNPVPFRELLTSLQSAVSSKFVNLGERVQHEMICCILNHGAAGH